MKALMWVAIPAIIFIGTPLLPRPSQEQLKVNALNREHQQSEAEADVARQKVVAEQKKSLCKVKLICERYATARSQCAVAANLQSCIDIKMGDEDTSYVSACTNDGKVFGITSADMPSALSCYFTK